MKNGLIVLSLISFLFFNNSCSGNSLLNELKNPGDDSDTLTNLPIIADHSYANKETLQQIPLSALEKTKANLHIAYGHTSHGSQITSGMTGLVSFANNGALGNQYVNDFFAWEESSNTGTLHLLEGDGYGDGPLDHDAGYYPSWYNETVEFLENPSNSQYNVIIWSWCGQVSSKTEQTMIDQYLDPMNQLEQTYPDVTFVYMTGHLDGSGLTGNLHLRNEQIRDYCRKNKKVLFDFADIECYDPHGTYFGNKIPNDNCDYDSNNDGSRDKNWATEWQNSHTEDVDWYKCSSAHSQALNANMKAYAAWWLWARLAGWDGK
ncbi:hypothetical protein [Spirochaeta isovalerica]|uniref:Uncharacterized protein n=1 Tax=Spirochaeta isovalerica TaxID=150 RepID=A0A841R976_9SPIO|nr:hypothetical protein [Spirochaeta isovalerica]MBB6479268.1 hypothetical protein [Spirochaeta isovalerica]